MFIRPCYRRKNGKTHAYWALVESYRTSRGSRQRVVAYLGGLDEKGRLGIHQAAQGGSGSRQERLFDEVEPEWVEVDSAKVWVGNCRAFGGPWLALELIDRLGLVDFLSKTIPRGREGVRWWVMSLVLIISRLCRPSSELHIAEHFYRQSALEDLLGVPRRKVTEQRLYRALDHLLPHKEALETFLKGRLGKLFTLEYELLLYDVTSTYFEGEAKGNPLARRGYSRDRRSDCKLVCIGLVVTQCGMPLGYEVFSGNRNDVTTLQEIVQTMERRYGKGRSRLGCRPGHDLGAEYGILAGSRAAIHRGHTSKHAQEIPAANFGGRLALDPRWIGSETLPISERSGDVYPVSQPGSS